MNGLNDFAENTELREGLRQPFPPKLVSKLPATPKRPALDYVSHAAVTDRLNREAPGWTFELERFIEFNDSNGLPHIMAVYGYMQIGSVRRYEVGEADGLDNYGRELKGAISDFIRRAAMRFGVALDLWAKEDLQQDTSLPSEGTRGSSPPLTTTAQGTGVSGGGTSVPDPSEAGAAQATTDGLGQASPSAPASDDVVASPDAAASGGDDGKGIGEGSEAAVSPAPHLPIEEPDARATDTQWERLLATCGGNKTKAVNRLNVVNKTSYTVRTAQEGATRAEVANAITGSVAA